MLDHNALVVVADGKHALLYRNVAKQGLELAEVDHLTPQNLADEGEGHAPQERSPKDEDEATFAKQLAERLNRIVLRHKAEQVAIVADPTTLGTMRKHYHKELESIIAKELAKDLTKSSPADVAKALS
ncbi:Protein required for attachment to host cells [Paracoccus isoporae]|uniref:Protein required for attachment to host cells n=1 Tax=Paracoccus isoporae TaxID=591205 RepID=A0A1G7AEW9_9RHOB|nr:host attachment family protein [Paracoccus isoporae]SDE13233.1 Protein required for attachment to host cells [Paracoccus isoporae]